MLEHLAKNEVGNLDEYPLTQSDVENESEEREVCWQRGRPTSCWLGSQWAPYVVPKKV